MAKKNVA